MPTPGKNATKWMRFGGPPAQRDRFTRRIHGERDRGRFRHSSRLAKMKFDQKKTLGNGLPGGNKFLLGNGYDFRGYRQRRAILNGLAGDRHAEQQRTQSTDQFFGRFNNPRLRNRRDNAERHRSRHSSSEAMSQRIVACAATRS